MLVKLFDDLLFIEDRLISLPRAPDLLPVLFIILLPLDFIEFLLFSKNKLGFVPLESTVDLVPDSSRALF
jgi:hypothetical protein